VSFYFIKEGEAMRFEDHLTIEQKQQLHELVSSKKKKPKPKSKPKQKKQEHVDWLDIMGTKNRGLRRKKGGAWG
jgi:non-homologous end joining protein Ku